MTFTTRLMLCPFGHVSDRYTLVKDFNNPVEQNYVTEIFSKTDR